VIAKGPLQSALSFKVTERRVKRPQFGGRSWGHLGERRRGGPRRSATANHIQFAAAVQFCSLSWFQIAGQHRTPEWPSAAGEPCAGADRPAHGIPQQSDSPAAFL